MNHSQSVGYGLVLPSQYSSTYLPCAGRRLRQLQAGPVALPPATADPMAPQSAQLSATPPPATPVKATDPDAARNSGAFLGGFDLETWRSGDESKSMIFITIFIDFGIC